MGFQDSTTSGIRTGSLPAIPFDKLCASARHIEGISRSDLSPGDRIEVQTRNSLYVIRVLGNGSFLVAGGWFRKSGLTASATGISGCTWGGRAIKTDWIAAAGLFIEFDNGVRTTRVQGVRWFRSQDSIH